MNQPLTAANERPEIPHDMEPVPSWLKEAFSEPREELWVQSQDCPIHVFRWGDHSKPSLILLHGFLAHSRCFAFIAPLLAKDYHIVAYDFSGMGDSGVREAYPDSVRVRELMDVGRETGIFDHQEKPTIISHSYGGGVGLATMEQHADQFSGLLICDLMTLRPERLAKHFEHASPPGSNDPRRPNRVYPDYPTAKKRFVLSPAQDVGEACLMDYMAYHSLKQVEGGWSWKFDPSVFNSQVNMEEKLLAQGSRIVNAPGRKAIVYGRNSLLFDDDSADYIRECGGQDIPIIGIPHAHHHLMLDQPIAFASVLDTVLAQWRCNLIA
jgi:pimeloyl-ACP methyl ester carboxylesterase